MKPGKQSQLLKGTDLRRGATVRLRRRVAVASTVPRLPAARRVQRHIGYHRGPKSKWTSSEALVR